MGNWLSEVWHGVSKSRPTGMLKFAQPDAYDWEKLISELGKTQQELLNIAANSSTTFISEIRMQDEVNEEASDKVYIDVSGETALKSCVISAVDIKISIVSTFPMCKIGSTLIELDEILEGNYFKEIDYTVEADSTEITVNTVLPNDTLGNGYTVTYSIIQGPTILSLNFIGGYPGAQTEVKAGDTFYITGVTNVACNAVKIHNFGACAAGTFEFPSTTNFSIAATIDTTGYTTQELAAKVQARNASGAYGPEKTTEGGDGVGTVKCNDTAPTFIDNGFTNSDNPGALAFKGIEGGIQDTTVAAYDSIVYSSDEFFIANSTTYEKPKVITCLNPGTYNDSVYNFTITATRAANGAVSIFQKVIEVADIAPILTVTQNEARLRSETTHVITVTSNQNLSVIPDLNIVVGGTWQGTSFVADPVGQKKIYTRTILVEHADAKGTAAWTQVAPAKNNADTNASITGDCIIGGFLPITVVFNHTPSWVLEPIDTLTEVVDVSKLKCYDNSGKEIFYQVDKTDNPYTFTITDSSGNLDPNGNYIYWSDLNAVAANVSGTSFLTIEETV